jgi:serine/threonine protein kinase/WD40 repeat protein
MTIDTLDALLAALRDSGLLDEEQLARLPALAARFPDPAALTAELQRTGWLTPYQAEELRAGRGDELVLGQYVVLSLLGQGGMGKVFKARHRLMKRVVALKVIRPALLAEPRAVSRFHREIEAVSRLSHPNIVAAFDADKVGNRHFLVTEYVEGTDLARLVKEHGPLPAGLASDCVRQAAVGLQHAHEQGLVHRDIKPANLLLSRSAAPGSPPLVKILDMGLARLHAEEGDGLTHTGAVMGTPDYIAPEQASDAHLVDIRADLYSLGCTLYFLLTGEPPFPGGTPMEKLFRHRYVAPRPVEVRRPELPPAVVAIVGKLMAKRPEKRYQTPAELAEALVPLAVYNPEDEASTIYLPKPPPAVEDGPGTIRPAAPAGETMHPEGGATRVEGPAEGLAKSPSDWSASPVPYVEPASPAGAVPAVATGHREAPPRRRPPLLLAGALILVGAAVMAGAVALPSLSSLWRRPAGGVTLAEDDRGRPVVTAPREEGSERDNTKRTSPAPAESSKSDTRREKPIDTGKPPPRDTGKPPVKPEEKALPPRLLASIAAGKTKTSAAFSRGGGSMVFATGLRELYYSTVSEKVVTGDPMSTQPYIDVPQAPAGAVSGDGRRVFYGTWDHPDGEITKQNVLKMWDVGEGGKATSFWPMLPIRWITCLAVSQDGNRVAVGTDNGLIGDDVRGPSGVYLWDLKKIEKPVFSKVYDGHGTADRIESVALSADGTRGVSSGRYDAVRWWDIVGGHGTQRGFHDKAQKAQFVKNVTITPAGDCILYLDDDGTQLRLVKFDAPAEYKTFKVNPESVTTLAFSPDGALVVTGNVDGEVQCWNVKTGEPVAAEGDRHKKRVLAVAVSEDRKYVYSAGADSAIRRWVLPQSVWAPPK